ncbi:Type III effector pipB [Fuerstiella marisgermanici]|uniref:Type III effector pipB n=2 Tax=Fuerstiella marisgermanici TaxID=1891926 RepID=A0A1P8WQF3_9PLAN|nr:Type III effector pipB [Fuerstiella marisgermanici]
MGPPLSPERGQLLKFLVDHKIDLKHLSSLGAVFDYADLRFTNLSKANLQNVSLQAASLQLSDLRDANLHDADLMFADLQGCMLDNACLDEAAIWRADLKHALLRGTKMRGTFMSDGQLLDAHVSGAFMPFPIPDADHERFLSEEYADGDLPAFDLNDPKDYAPFNLPTPDLTEKPWRDGVIYEVWNYGTKDYPFVVRPAPAAMQKWEGERSSDDSFDILERLPAEPPKGN